MARDRVMGPFTGQKDILSLQVQVSGEKKVLKNTFKSGMLVVAAQNKLMQKGDL